MTRDLSACSLSYKQLKGATEMPKVSRESAQVEDHGVVEDRHDDIDGYTVSFVTFRQDIDATPLLKGLPDDRCQCPHWGYVLQGRMTYRFADHDETYRTGDAFYLPCATAANTIVTVMAANAKITGGGWISNGTGRTSFGFNVFSDVTGLHGQLEVNVKGSKNKFHGNRVLSLVATANTGTWTGTGRWNGADGYRFTVSVVDNGTSGKNGDTISIVIMNPANVIVFTTGGPQPLKGGNIVVH